MRHGCGKGSQAGACGLAQAPGSDEAVVAGGTEHGEHGPVGVRVGRGGPGEGAAPLGGEGLTMHVTRVHVVRHVLDE